MANNRWLRNSLVYLLIIIGVIVIFYTMIPTFGASNELDFTEVIEMAKNRQISRIVVEGQKLTIYPRVSEGIPVRQSTSQMGEQTDLVSVLADNGVEIGSQGVQVYFKGSGGLGSLFGILLNFLPLIFFGGLILFMMRQAQGSNNQTMSFGRSKAKMMPFNRPTVTFNDVAGVDEAKIELEEVVEFLKYPERFLALGARIPKGVLLVGSPGTGKTLLARAVAGEAGVPFFHISGSEFVEMFVGVGAARVRDLFDQAKRNVPCIVFVDEIDAVGRHRGAGLGGGHDEREQTLNQLLVEMDGFETNTNIIVLAATNRPDILDPALLRPGRFDRRVTLDLPDVVGRQAILKVHSAGKPIATSVNLGTLAKETPGFSGADLSNLINEAALLAARKNLKSINMPEFEEAVERVIAGPQRKSRVINPREKEMTAYHEAGHALVAWSLPHADKVHKISIISRGQMGGHTTLLPEEDRYLWTKNQFEDMLAVTMGGRVAEEQIFDEVTTGASNDIERATKIALGMVKRYGMSKSLGPRTFGKREEMVFLGRELSEERDYGDRIAEEIDQEVKELINHAYQQAQQILTDGKPKLVQIAEYLIEHEAVSGDELTRLFDLRANGPEDDPGTPVKPPEAPTPYAPRPAQPPIVPNPAPSLSSQNYSPPDPAPGEAND
ncbi:MAG: ATP-dependent zinc metalloprotease FtsH [Chloroflexi bacterium]|nr:ATP-dependent zinc metalloprotease FtsH [Chloroflexota bacterium]MDA1220071.1 ATP-dependent zinc metalloprotease FtsH [Chloroflexota bacterium]PKB57187.1 MAG: cell division protein FtsH [SAR202 cluster bacterium Casp-Chloro-G3]